MTRWLRREGLPAAAYGWLGLAVVLATPLVVYVNRSHLRGLLSQPHACGVRSGCVDTSPLIATAVMLGFDAILAGLAIWQCGAGGLLGPKAKRGVRGQSVSSEWGWRAACLAILALALISRLVAPEAAQFRWDEAEIARLALEGLLHGQLALTGMNTTVDLPNLPGSVYLYAPVVAWFAYRPGAEGAAFLLVGLLSALTAPLCALFVRRWSGSQVAGLVAGLCFALGFWATFTGRRPWPPNFMPLFAVLYLDAILLLAIRRQGRALVWALGWLTALVHFHYVGATLAPLLLVAAWFGRKGIRQPHLYVGLALVVVLLSPFLFWEFSVVNLLRDVEHLLTLGGGPATLDETSLRLLFGLAGPGGLDYWVSPLYRVLEERAAFALLLAGSGGVLLAVGLLAGGLAIARGNGQRRVVTGFVLAWLLAPVLLLARHTAPVFAWYLYFLLSGVSVVMGIGAGALWSVRLRGRAGEWIGRGGATGIVAAYLAGSVAVLSAVLGMASERLPMAEYEPAGPLSEAAQALNEAWRAYGSPGPRLVGGRARDADLWRLAAGYGTPTLVFDDCREVVVPPPRADLPWLVYGIVGDTPAARLLEQAGRLEAEVQRPGLSPYRVFVLPRDGLVGRELTASEIASSPECSGRRPY